MKLRYLLKRRGAKGGTHPIYLAMYSGDLTEIIFTGHRTTLKEWSVQDRSPKDHSGDIFKAIEKVKADVQKAIRRLEADEKPVTPYTVKEAYTNFQDNKQTAQAQADKKAKGDLVTVTKLANKWTETELFRFRKSTQNQVKSSIANFTAYLKVAGLASLERNKLTQEVISGYERYLLEKKKLADSSHGKNMKQLRWFLKTIDFDTKNIKIRNSKKTIVSLTLDELVKLENVDVSESIEFAKAKDMFLLGCYTGLRVSDLKRLNHTNTRNGLISLKLVKTNKDVEIPIIADCERILSKYKHHAPKISEQALNENIKLVCAKAKINKGIEINTTKGGVRITTTVPKHEVITSHIAGKTFITLAPQRWGLSPAEIAAIVGKDLKTLLGSYFNLPGDEARRKIIQMDTVKMKVS